jgi:hypothetical protein
MEEENLEKAAPYQRLQAILSEGKSASELELTKKGRNNIDELLGIEEETLTTWEKFKNFLKKIDSKIFSKPSKISNRFQKR